MKIHVDLEKSTFPGCDEPGADRVSELAFMAFHFPVIFLPENAAVLEEMRQRIFSDSEATAPEPSSAEAEIADDVPDARDLQGSPTKARSTSAGNTAK